MNTLDQIAVKIIREQELIIGPIAWDEAGKVIGIHILDKKTGSISIDTTDEKTTINQLVAQYEHFFGRAAREVCKEAAASLVADLPADQVPSSLQ